MNLQEIKAQAQAEIDTERFRAAVDAEKQRLLAYRSPWSRFTAWLPFTINWKTK